MTEVDIGDGGDKAVYVTFLPELNSAPSAIERQG